MGPEPSSGGGGGITTYPGMTDPRRTDKVYTNPTNPYYDPVWSQSYVRNDEPIREGDHTSYYAPGYDVQNRNYYLQGMGGYYGGGRMMGGMIGRGEGMMDGYYDDYRYGGGMMGGMYATTTTAAAAKWKKSSINGNSLMRTTKSALFQGSIAQAPRSKSSALGMSYYGGGPGWDGPMYDVPMIDGPMMPPPDYGRVIRSGDYAGATTGSGAYGANQMNPNYYRRGGGSDVRRGGVGSRGRGRGMAGQGVMMGGPPGPMGVNPFINQESLRDSSVGWSGPPGPYFGRDNAIGRQSLKDMAARSSKSYDAEVIRSMNNRSNARRAALGGGDGVGMSSFPVEAGGERKQTTTSTTSTSSQYVPLSSIYGPPRSAAPMDRSPPLSGGPPPPLLRQPIIDTNAMAIGELPQSIHTARTVRPSVVLVTSEGVRKENSQGSGFVVAFDDSTMEEEDDDDDGRMKDRVHILTSAHVAPPGWKVSVTFPCDPDKQYPATVVGRKLNSDLALLCVETIAEENEDYPFPPPLVLTGEEVSTDTLRSDDFRVPTSEIGSPVYSFGYPMGVEGPTMTSGILSATTKGINYMDAPTGEEPSEISKSRPFEKTSFVITDAAMAGGMSGGPLVNNEGIVLGINALVRPDLRALGNYAVSALECEIFLEKLEQKRSKDAAKSGTTKRVNSRRVNGNERSGKMAELQQTASTDVDSGVAGFRVMLYGYSSNKSEATKVLRRIAGLDELRAENAMRSAQSFGAGVVDEFYVAESGGRERAIKAARKSADELSEKLKEEGMMPPVGIRDPITNDIIDTASPENTENGVIYLNGSYRPVVAVGNWQKTCLAISRASAFSMYPVLVVVFLTKMKATQCFLSRTPLSMYLTILNQAHEHHAHAGAYLAFDVWVHTLFHVLRWTSQGNLSLLWTSAAGLSGLIAVIATPLIAFPMMYYKDRLGYEVRKGLHFLFYLFAIGLCFHVPTNAVPNGGYIAPVLGTCILLYTLDAWYVYFFMCEKIETTAFRVLTSGVRMSMGVSERFRGSAAARGGFAYVNIPWINDKQWHPFSLFEDPHDPSTLQVFLLKNGDWTNAVHKSLSRDTTRPPYSQVSSYDNQILVASGVGITPALAAISAFKSSRRINLIWAVRDAEMLE
ncbi:hypothetical protein ACHAXA_009116 [Cyclostephanos tholiformis]|uniref:FAD-binding 8 domain-containing protein n=1 Tax=Cyclostephanos tholiformis TaxID=382380 RepID=A0ABD3RXM2_9STRA